MIWLTITNDQVHWFRAFFATVDVVYFLFIGWLTLFCGSVSQSVSQLHFDCPYCPMQHVQCIRNHVQMSSHGDSMPFQLYDHSQLTFIVQYCSMFSEIRLRQITWLAFSNVGHPFNGIICKILYVDLTHTHTNTHRLIHSLSIHHLPEREEEEEISL